MDDEKQAKPFTDGLVIGRMVHYRLRCHDGSVVCRPATVVRVWPESNGMVQLQVQVDGSNDLGGCAYHGPMPGSIWQTSVKHAPVGDDGAHQWHWPQECSPEESSGNA